MFTQPLPNSRQTEIELSYIHDFPDDDVIMAALVDEFGKKHHIKVHLRGMNWDNAWAELFTFAMDGNGPHVSHVGSTWIPSLAKLHALRPFKPAEIADMGGASAFMKPAWYSTGLFKDQRTWAIPWTSWSYVVCYRKDLLEQVGINVFNAFGSIQTLDETLKRLKNSALEIPWINPQLPGAQRELLHVAASWVWAAGGDFLDDSNSNVILNSPEAITGLVAWLNTYRAMREAHRKISEQEAFNLFREGRAAVVLTNIREADKLIDMKDNPLVRDNLGIAPLTETPWSGGGDFVIWNHIQGLGRQEEMAVELVKFLTSKEVNIRCRRELGTMPARMDALEELYPVGNPLHDAAMLIARDGRAYHTTSFCRRIEYQMSQELGIVIQEIDENPDLDPAEVLRARLDPLAWRLNITLEQSQ